MVELARPLNHPCPGSDPACSRDGMRRRTRHSFCRALGPSSPQIRTIEVLRHIERGDSVRSTLLAALVHSAIIVASDRSLAQSPAAAPAILTGTAAYGDWRSDAPGRRRRLSAADLPVPYASRSAGNPPGVVAAPRDA